MSEQEQQPGPTPPDEPPAPGEPAQPDPYELAPEPPQASKPARGPDPRLGRPGLTDDFDEDADFERDPEVERALGKSAPESVVTSPPKPEMEPFIDASGPAPKVMAIVGGVIVLGAVVVAMAMAEKRWYAAGIGVAYLCLLHTATGVLAIAAAAHLHGKTLGRIDQAAARMLIAVGLFAGVVSIRVVSWGAWDRVVMVPAAAGAYFLALVILLRGRVRECGAVGAVHATLGAATWFLVAIQAWVSAG